jgi:hypothetical protein
MSWKQFEKEVVEKLETEGFKNPDDFAKFFTNKYDECVKRGHNEYISSQLLPISTTELPEFDVCCDIDSNNNISAISIDLCVV